MRLGHSGPYCGESVQLLEIILTTMGDSKKMVRRISVVTLFSDYIKNDTKCLEKSGAILCNQDYYRRVSSSSLTSKRKSSYQSVSGKNEIFKNEMPDKLVCESLEPKDEELLELKDENLFDPIDEKELKPQSSSCRARNVEKDYATISQKAKLNSVDLMKTFRKKSLTLKSNQQTIRRNSLRSSKENNTPKPTMLYCNDSGDADKLFPVGQWVEAVDRYSEKDDPAYVRANMDQLPDIFTENTYDRFRRSSTYKKVIKSYKNEISLSGNQQLIQTNRENMDGNLMIKCKDTTKVGERNNGISVMGLPPVWTNPSEVRKAPGRYDVRQEYADNIEKNWYENFQRELNMKEGGVLKQDADERFGYSDEDVHKSSLFNQLRGEYENTFLNINCSTGQRNCDHIQGTKNNIKESSCYQADDNYSFKIPLSDQTQDHNFNNKESLNDHADYNFSSFHKTHNIEENISYQTGNAKFVLKDLSSQFASDVKIAEMDHLKRNTSSKSDLIIRNGQMVSRKVACEIQKMKEQHTQDLYYQEKKQVEDKGQNNYSILPALTLTEIRSLRLKLKKFNELHMVKRRLKGKQRFRQIACVVLFVMHFRTILLKLRERKRKLAKKRRIKALKQAKANMYSPFQRNKAMNGKVMEDCDEEHPDEQIQPALSRYEEELKRIMQDDDSFSDFTPRSRCRLENRRSSDPGPIQPDEFRIMVSTLGKKKDSNSGRRSGKRQMSSRPKTGTKTNSNLKRLVQETGLIAEIKMQLNLKATKKTAVKKKDKEIVIVKTDICNGYSRDDMYIKKGQSIDLRTLLKDVDIPAKEIKIQIAERKMKRRQAKLLIAVNKWKDKTLESKNDTEDSASLNGSCPNWTNCYSRGYIKRGGNRLTRRPSHVFYGLSKNQAGQNLTKKKKSPVYDEEILNLSSLVLDMRSCRYIRWTKRYQDILSRLEAIELEAL